MLDASRATARDVYGHRPRSTRRQLATMAVTSPFVVAIDQREKAPFSFDGLLTDTKDQTRPLTVRKQSAFLETGDYSIIGMEHLLTVERKSLADLYSTLGQHRERFFREFERMAAMQYAALVIEADWVTITRRPPEQSSLHPKTVYRTLLSWSERFGVHVFPMPSRRFAEVTTYRLLEKFWEHRKEDVEKETRQ